MTAPTPHNDFITVPGVGNVGPNEYLALVERYAALASACRGLVAYRAANTLNFQLEKADDYIKIIDYLVSQAEGGEQ